MPCRATQERWVMVEGSENMWSIGEGHGKPLQYSSVENPMNSTKRKTDMTLKGEFLRLIGAQYATGDHWRNNYRMKRWKQSENNSYLWI